jgi:HTH-type transcriptional regulator / antitoxin HigA
MIEDFASCPGATLREAMEAIGMDQNDLAERTGISPDTIHSVMEGTDPVNHDMAYALEKVFNVPSDFWLRLEFNYRNHLSGMIG